ncbi:MAG: MarR family transcriptional regulator [Paracoccaceae bacterium]
MGPLLHDAARAVRRRFEQRSTGYGLSSAQWRLMAILGRDGRSSQSRLAEQLEIESISVSRLLDRMEAGGWVSREMDENDRRVRIIVPTDKTIAAYEDVRRMASEVYDEALAGIGAAERAALVSGLNTIITNLSAKADLTPADSTPKDKT